MLISIIIPVYNRKLDLFRALHSVTIQKFNNVELIVVNDGSSDGVEGSFVASPFAESVKLINLPTNYGVSAARNAGARQSAGEFLIFLDSDDEQTERSLDIFQDAIISQTNTDVFFGNAAFYTNGNLVNIRKASDPYHSGKKTNFGLYLAGAFCIRKKLFEKVGGYDEQITFGENTELFWRIKNLNPIICIISETLVRINRPEKNRISIKPENIKMSVTYILNKHSILFAEQPHLYWTQLNILSNAFMRLKQYDEAVNSLKYSIKLKPFSWISYMRLLRVFYLSLIDRLSD